jgi:hypothetical protein
VKRTKTRVKGRTVRRAIGEIAMHESTTKSARPIQLGIVVRALSSSELLFCPYHAAQR